MRKEKSEHCPFHAGTGWDPCEPPGCTILGEARILQDRLDAIETLVEQARTGVLTGSGNAGYMPVTAALEAARLLAHSITRDDDLKVKGQNRVLWTVLSSGRMRRATARAASEGEPAPPSLRAVPGIK